MFIENLNTDELLELWEEILKREITVDVATVRGWILDELENRFPVKMEIYYDDDYTDEQLREIIKGGESMSIYTEKGYKSRKDYLINLAEEYGADVSHVFALSGILGENEDFDGLIIALEDGDL